MKNQQSTIDFLSNGLLQDFENARDSAETDAEYQTWEDRIEALEEQIDILLQEIATETQEQIA